MYASTLTDSYTAVNLVDRHLADKQHLAGLLVKKRQRQQPAQASRGLLDWTILRRPLLDPKSLFSLPDHLYLIDIYNETAQEVVVKKAAQLGFSEWLISYALHACDERKLDVAYVMPTEGDVSDFSQSRFGPALEASPYLSEIVVGGGSGNDGKRGSDKVTLKRIRESFLYLRGGHVSTDTKTGQVRARQLKTIPVDVLILDELDEMDSRAPDIARKRLGHSHVAEVRSVSTPTYPGVGIDAAWAISDQREWHLKCPRCGEWQYLTIDHIVAEWDDLRRPVHWHGREEGRAWVACQKCKREMDRLARGFWVPRFPGRKIAGYHPTKLISPVADLVVIVDNLKEVDETKRKEADNQDLAETHTPRGGNLTDEILDGCRRDYGHGSVSGEETFMGVDVGSVLHVVIRGPLDLETGERPQRWAGETTFNDLGNLIAKYRVRTVVIDALPETTKAREFQTAHPGRVWLAYYNLSESKHPQPVVWDLPNGIVNLDRTRTLDQTFARFYEPVINTLPAHAKDIKDYYAHLKAPIRVLQKAGAKQQTVAMYIENSPDHLAHAENYCQIAQQMTLSGKIVF